VNLDLQNTLDNTQSRRLQVPLKQQFQQWVEAVLSQHDDLVEMTIRISDRDEITQLNRDYRGKDKATNVLSFPFETPAEIDELALLGDVVICAEVVMDEAQQQQKSIEAHWAHMVIHGTLHLLGYDHMDDTEANEMELLEISILAELGYSNPYQ
jgi:probable rRNA maturation factor